MGKIDRMAVPVKGQKPHKGRIVETGRFKSVYGLGYGLYVKFVDHPEFGGMFGHTSPIVKTDEAKPRHLNDGYEVETLNSRYTVIPEEKHVEDRNRRVREEHCRPPVKGLRPWQTC